MKDFFDWFVAKNFLSVRSFSLYVTLWMSWEAFFWAGQFALSTDKTGLEVAAIIAAVTAPITYLQTKVFEIYAKSRSGQQ